MACTCPFGYALGNVGDALGRSHRRAAVFVNDQCHVLYVQKRRRPQAAGSARILGSIPLGLRMASAARQTVPVASLAVVSCLSRGVCPPSMGHYGFGLALAFCGPADAPSPAGVHTPIRLLGRYALRLGEWFATPTHRPRAAHGQSPLSGGCDGRAWCRQQFGAVARSSGRCWAWCDGRW